MRAVVLNPTRIIGENSRSVYPGDVLEGSEAEEAVAAGNAIVEEAPASPEAPAEGEQAFLGNVGTPNPAPEAPQAPESPATVDGA